MMENMLNRMKNKVISIVAPDPALPSSSSSHSVQHAHNHSTINSNKVLPEKFSYARPGMFMIGMSLVHF